MKTIILNGSPRKNWNTAMMLREAQKGAESIGAETEYIDLFDLSYTGCRSCLACKRKDAERCKCFWKDDLSPVIDRIFESDALILGSPIYLGDVTSQVHGLIERLHFCALSYDNYSNYFTLTTVFPFCHPLLTTSALTSLYPFAVRSSTTELYSFPEKPLESFPIAKVCVSVNWRLEVTFGWQLVTSVCGSCSLIKT